MEIAEKKENKTCRLWPASLLRPPICIRLAPIKVSATAALYHRTSLIFQIQCDVTHITSSVTSADFISIRVSIHQKPSSLRRTIYFPSFFCQTLLVKENTVVHLPEP